MSWSRALIVVAFTCGLAGCGGSAGQTTAVEGTGRASPPAASQSERPCGARSCTSDEMCVETQGAVCQPLPPPGESCPDGCTLTEHCCNCSAFACFEPARTDCPSGPSCDCLDRSDGTSVLLECSGERRECNTDGSGIDVLCIRVALDEDPFAGSRVDAGAP